MLTPTADLVTPVELCPHARIVGLRWKHAHRDKAIRVLAVLLAQRTGTDWPKSAKPDIRLLYIRPT
jgi:hypothetical protein